MTTLTDPAFDDVLRQVDVAADRFLEGRKIPGVVYGVVQDGRLIHVRGIGTLRVGEEQVPADDSVFRIASMTKSFTAATVIRLRDEGLLGLDDPVARYVTDLAGWHGPSPSPALDGPLDCPSQREGLLANPHG